jgi:hypothetical protein
MPFYILFYLKCKNTEVAIKYDFGKQNSNLYVKFELLFPPDKLHYLKSYAGSITFIPRYLKLSKYILLCSCTDT